MIWASWKWASWQSVCETSLTGMHANCTTAESWSWAASISLYERQVINWVHYWLRKQPNYSWGSGDLWKMIPLKILLNTLTRSGWWRTIPGHSLRERLPMGQFLCKLGDLLAKWSKNRDPTSPNYTKFCCKRTITLPHWTRAYQWAQKNREVLQHRGRSCVQYFTAVSGMPPTSTETLKDFEKKEMQKHLMSLENYSLIRGW